MGNEWGRSMRGRRGSGPALLNVLVFMRAVNLSMQSCVEWLAGPNVHRELHAHNSLPVCPYIRLDAGVGIRYFPSAYLSTPIFRPSASAWINYSQLAFYFLIAVRSGFMANNRFFLPGQEFPLWTGWVALIDGSGEVKLSCNVNEEHQLLYLFSLHGNECVHDCVHYQKDQWITLHGIWVTIQSGALFVLGQSVCDCVIFKPLCPSDLCHKRVNTSGVSFSRPACL